MEDTKKIMRISIIGGSGSGKSTLAKNLSEKLNLPVIHIDGINYAPNWIQKDKNERDKLLLKITKTEKWIMDGTYTSTLSERLFRSNLIIFLDYSTVKLLYGVILRNIKLRGNERKEIKGCRDKLSLDFFRFVLTWRKQKRKKVLEKIKLYNDKTKIFKSRKSLNKWYKKNFGDDIVI